MANKRPAADPLRGIDPGQLEAIIRKFPVRACVFVTNFSNPLGSSIPDEKKAALVELITRYKIPLIEDDIYGELYFRHRPKTCKSYDKEGGVLYCSSLSKSLAPGYRIGWTLAGRFTRQLIRTKLMHTVTGTTLTLHTQCLRYMQGSCSISRRRPKYPARRVGSSCGSNSTNN